MRMKIAEKLVYRIFDISIPIIGTDIIKGSLTVITGLVGCYGVIILLFILDDIVFRIFG